MAGRSWLAVGVLVLSACGGAQVEPVADPVTPSASSLEQSPSPRPTGSSEGLLLAVVRTTGLELHRVDPATAVAHLERVLEPPAQGAEVLDVTAARDGLVCASWHTGAEAHVTLDHESVATCYQAGTSNPLQVTGVERPEHLALSADGRRLAWSEVPLGLNPPVATARLDGTTVSSVRRFLGDADQPEEGDESFTGTVVQDLAWVDETHLAISSGTESDDGPSLRLFEIAAADRRGWLDDGEPVPVPEDGYFAYDSVVTAEPGHALAVQRGTWMDDSAPPGRAVRVELSSGRVLDVIATGAPGRDVVAVSGTREATFYATKARSTDNRLAVHLRRAGESRGRPVSGLPADATVVVAPG